MQHLDPQHTNENPNALLAPPVDHSQRTRKLRKQVPPAAPTWITKDDLTETDLRLMQPFRDRTWGQPIIVLRGKQVDRILSSSRSTRYERLNPRSPRFDPTFPKPFRLGPNSVGWDSRAITSWIESRIRASENGVTVLGSTK